MDRQGGSDSLRLRKTKQNMVPRVKPETHQKLEPDIMASSSSSSPSPSASLQKLGGTHGRASNHSSKYLHTKLPSDNLNRSASTKAVAETDMDKIPRIASNGTQGGAGDVSGSSDGEDVVDDADTCQLLPSSSREQPGGDEDESQVIVEDEVRLL
ncbi:hypothetical protein ElyMa_000416200 [Elysia marginata]|uniref:Uncharacterized protein n=1 Tax=Elysia marginata TaxID=1093978 RepID=A0AAV4FKN3_9GAST|nr:hypothetical protein ElyMa_000416200 [Elysia marginata]